MNILIIFISVLLNYALVNVMIPHQSKEKVEHLEKKSQKIKLKKRFQQDLFSLLSVGRGYRGERNIVSQKISSSSMTTEGNEIFARIDQVLNYPVELSELGIEGHVFVALFVDQVGIYHEKFSIFKSSNKFLEIHVRQIIRRAFREKLKTSGFHEGQYSLIFNFEISTTPNSFKEKSSRTENIEFFRSNYGVVNGADRVVDTANKVISGVANIFSLLRYLPSIEKKKKMKQGQALQKLKNDKYW